MTRLFTKPNIFKTTYTCCLTIFISRSKSFNNSSSWEKILVVSKVRWSFLSEGIENRFHCDTTKYMLSLCFVKIGISF